MPDYNAFTCFLLEIPIYTRIARPCVDLTFLENASFFGLSLSSYFEIWFLRKLFINFHFYLCVSKSSIATPEHYLCDHIKDHHLFSSFFRSPGCFFSFTLIPWSWLQCPSFLHAYYMIVSVTTPHDHTAECAQPVSLDPHMTHRPYIWLDREIYSSWRPNRIYSYRLLYEDFPAVRYAFW